MANIIHRNAINREFGLEVFPEKLEKYIDLLSKQKMSDFFFKTDMLMRLMRAQSITLYRCSRWINVNGQIVPEWHSSISWYQSVSETLEIPLQIFVSTFDIKTEENKVLMYEQQEKFGYKIVPSSYEVSVKWWQEHLTHLLSKDEVFAQRIQNVQEREQSKFQKLENLMLSFAEYFTGVEIANRNNSALFIHDTRRIGIIRYMEKKS